MHTEAVAQAAALLANLWREGAHIPALPPEIRPGSRADGYAVQARLVGGEAAIGWKIAATSKAGQSHIGVSGPLAGRLLASRHVEPGGTIPLGSNNLRVAEVEFAFRMASNMPPRPAPYTTDEVLAAVASLHPAIEVPASRFSDFVYAGEAQLIADVACADYVTIGAATTADWRGVDLSQHKVTGIVTRNGETIQTEGIGGNALGDPRIALTWLVNELSDIGTGIKAGEVVITGTCIVPVPVQPEDHFVSDLGEFGSVGVSIG